MNRRITFHCYQAYDVHVLLPYHKKKDWFGNSCDAPCSGFVLQIIEFVRSTNNCFKSGCTPINTKVISKLFRVFAKKNKTDKTTGSLNEVVIINLLLCLLTLTDWRNWSKENCYNFFDPIQKNFEAYTIERLKNSDDLNLDRSV